MTQEIYSIVGSVSLKGYLFLNVLLRHKTACAIPVNHHFITILLIFYLLRLSRLCSHHDNDYKIVTLRLWFARVELATRNSS